MEQNTFTWIRSFARIGRISEEDLELLKKYEFSIASARLINHSRMWIEIGIGSGENAINQVLNNEDVFLLCCEPYLKGVMKFVKFLDKNKITNASVWPGDARYIIKDIKPESVEKIFILFPDPWPKKSHYKRRIINVSMLSMIYSKLIPNGELIISTDEPSYIQHIQQQLKTYNKFEHFISDERHIENYTKTKYHKKALALKNTPTFFYCKKVRYE